MSSCPVCNTPEDWENRAAPDAAQARFQTVKFIEGRAEVHRMRGLSGIGCVLDALVRDVRNLPIDAETPALEEPRDDSGDPDGERRDWYCERCSEVVPLKERCRICGAEEGKP